MCAISAQTLVIDNEILNWEAKITAGLNTDGWQLDFGAAYFPIAYAGVKADIGFAGEIEQIGDWGKDESETGHHYARRLKFIPGLVLRTPRLVEWKGQDAGFYVFAEPGMVISPGASGSHRANVISWDFKGGINLQLGQGMVLIGYGISTFSLFSGRPTNMTGLPDNDNHITHSVFVGTAYKF